MSVSVCGQIKAITYSTSVNVPAVLAAVSIFLCSDSFFADAWDCNDCFFAAINSGVTSKYCVVEGFEHTQNSPFKPIVGLNPVSVASVHCYKVYRMYIQYV